MKNNLVYKNLVFDKEAILHLYKDNQWKAYTDHPKKIYDGIQNSLDCIGVYDSSILVGLIRTVGDKNTIIFIQDILILKQYQRHGIGKKLMQIIIDKYKEVRQITLVTDDTEKTRKFYESVGMIDFETKGVIGFSVKK